jgi:hypothetical protein
MTSSCGVKPEIQPELSPDDQPVLADFLADLDQRVAHYTRGIMAVNNCFQLAGNA